MHPPYDGSRVDAFSLGCLALELALGGEWFKAAWLHLYMTHGALHDRARLVQALAATRDRGLALLVADERRAAAQAQLAQVRLGGPICLAASAPLSERRRAQTLPDVTHAAGSANAGGATNFETAEMASHAGLCDFLLSALEFDPQERLTASAALGHPWLSRLA